MDEVNERIHLDKLAEREETRPGFFDLLPYDFGRGIGLTPEILDELCVSNLGKITSDEPKFPRPRSVPVRPLVQSGGWYSVRFNFNRRR